MGRYELEFEISRYKLLNIEQMNNKVLLYNTGNYIEYPVIDHNGKEYIYMKKNIYVSYIHMTHTYESLCIQQNITL